MNPQIEYLEQLVARSRKAAEFEPEGEEAKYLRQRADNLQRRADELKQLEMPHGQG